VKFAKKDWQSFVINLQVRGQGHSRLKPRRRWSPS